MTERQLQFRVGIFVILALAAAGTMVFQFGKLKNYVEPRYHLVIHFQNANGVHPSTAVLKHGIEIGDVQKISFDDQRGGVLVDVEIRNDVLLREDAQPRLIKSLLGASVIEFLPGSSDRFLKPGMVVQGKQNQSPMETVQRLEEKLNRTVDSFNSTSREWEKVAQNLNNLLQTNHGNLELVIERTAESLRQFSLTMQTAQKSFSRADNILGSPQNQENLRKTLEVLPQLAEDTRLTILAVRSSVEKVDQNLENLNGVTEPLARKSASIVTRLDGTMGNLESLTREMNDFARLVSKEDGSLKRFASDPQLYRNLNRSAESLAVLLKNLEPVLRDVRIFSDKVARHPELMGVSGALNGSSGLKDPPPEKRVRQAGGFQRGVP